MICIVIIEILSYFIGYKIRWRGRGITTCHHMSTLEKIRSLTRLLIFLNTKARILPSELLFFIEQQKILAHDVNAEVLFVCSGSDAPGGL